MKMFKISQSAVCVLPQYTHSLHAAGVVCDLLTGFVQSLSL